MDIGGAPLPTLRAYKYRNFFRDQLTLSGANVDRGIIASAGTVSRIENGVRFAGNLSPEDIRYYILYWDKVIIPTSNLFHAEIPDEKDLIECGAIERPSVVFSGTFNGNQFADALLSCQSIIAKSLVKDKSIDWVVHQIGEECSFPPGFNQRRNIIRLDLSNILPVPSNTIPINEILEFKDRRRDELRCLHEDLDSLYQSILSSPDADLASRKAISHLKTSIENLEIVSSERFNLIKRYDFSIELNLNGKDIAIGASAASFLGMFAGGISVPIATTLGAMASILKVSAKATSTFQPAGRNTKLAYISRARKEEIFNRTPKK